MHDLYGVKREKVDGEPIHYAKKPTATKRLHLYRRLALSSESL